MNTQENQVLQDFLIQLVQAKGIAKDPQADALIASAVSQQPDAAYLLVQRAMLLEQALNSAKVQITQLQSDLQVARSTATTSSFLSADSAWGNSAISAPRPAMPTVMTSPSQNSVPMQSPEPVAKPGFLSGGAGGLLGTVAATAAGVAGGAFLFQGIENLMGHHGNVGTQGQNGFAGLGPTNTTVNNYYAADTTSEDNDSDSSDDTQADSSSDDDSTLI